MSLPAALTYVRLWQKSSFFFNERPKDLLKLKKNYQRYRKIKEKHSKCGTSKDYILACEINDQKSNTKIPSQYAYDTNSLTTFGKRFVYVGVKRQCERN